MKRIISIVLVLAICCGMFAVMATASGKFTDVPNGEWYTEAVTWAVDNEITNGTGNNTFTPDGVCTRAQIVTFLWRSFDRPYGNFKNIESIFNDVPNSFYYPAVKWAITFDITNGVGEKRFAPEASCTRAQIVTFLWRAEDFVSEDGRKNSISFRGILATEFDDAVTASFVRNGENIGRTVSYSVNSYICGAQNSTNETLAQLVQALCSYGKAAESYANQN